MSNKSGTSNQVISLPQGGGALSGMGEKFAPDLHSGTGNFTVPIALPAGRNGFQPELSLVYSTGNGNSPYGLGWSLSVSGVMRKTSQGIPQYNDQLDTFVLSKAEDLVLVEKIAGITRYRPRTEGLFARIEHHQQDGNDYWQVWNKNGLVSFYGTPRPEDASTDWHDPAVIYDPNKPTHIFNWQLSKTVDTFGNRIEYEYVRELSLEDNHQGIQLYLQTIHYANYDRDRFLAEVKFEYETRPDPFSAYRAGFEIRTDRRCKQIAVYTNAEVEQLVRTYELIYRDRETDAADLPLNQVSLLSQVKVIGHDGAQTEELPPLEFGYSNFQPQGRDFFSLQGQELPGRSLGNPELELADLFGNGLPDIIEMNGTVRYWRNLGNGKFDLPREMKNAPAGLILGDPGVQLIDADGDGRIDLLVNTGQIAGYFPLNFDGSWDSKSLQRYEVAPSFDLEGSDVQLVDLTGDGVTDAIRSDNRLECFFNDPEKGWQETHFVERRDLEDFPNVNFADPRVKWGDMSGDGLQDIMLVHDGNIEYWANLGYGNWGKRISMRNSPRFRYGYDPRRVLVGDIDGDGLDDIVYVDDKKVILWINQSGNSWSEPIEIKGTPSVSDLDAVRLMDLLGTGIVGVLWSSDAGDLSRNSMYFLDFTGGVKPYLLNEMDNNMGSLTKVGYTPSVQFYLEDEQKRRPWQTPLPFPVQTVSKVETIDRLSQGKLTTEYKYHYGYWDGTEREFRGFGMVEQCDTETFADYQSEGLHRKLNFATVEDRFFSPPTLTKTWFHQGAVGAEYGEWQELEYRDFWQEDPQILTRPTEMETALNNLPRRARQDAYRAMRGQVLRTELYALDGTERADRPYTVTESLPGVREEVPPAERITLPESDEARRIFFAFNIAQRTTQWERGAEPMTQFGFMEDYDPYGQVRSQISIALPRRQGEPLLVTQGVMDYAQKDTPEVYIVDRIARTTGYEIINDGSMSVAELKQAIADGTVERDLQSQSLSYYDGEAFTGLPSGEIGSFGAVVRSQTLVLTEEILQAAYQGDDTLDLPPYLDPININNWMEEYPQEFREQLESLPGLAGYTFYSGDEEHTKGYFVTTARNKYDFQSAEEGRGLLLTTRSPLGRDTEIIYDRYGLLPEQVADPLGLTSAAIYNYRVLQPSETVDSNGNRMAYSFTPLGLLASTAILDKDESGDTLEIPSVKLEYDFQAFSDRQQPVSVRTIQREHHIKETDVPESARDATIETIEYSDGFERLLQTRTQAEDLTFGDPTFGDGTLPREQGDEDTTREDIVGSQRTEDEPIKVIVSGWQIYDNKGRVVEQYEPFCDRGWDYAPPQAEQYGQKAIMFYDPRGQVIRTVNPDGSEQQVIYGIPEDLTNPDNFIPTPWEAYTYDANDNRGRTHATGDETHWNTPASIEIDALSRTIQAVERNGSNPQDWYVTRSSYDIRGNLLTVTDALGREAFRYFYDLTPRQENASSQVLRIESIDAGTRRIVFDAVGNEVERRDSKGALILSGYDLVNRPQRIWARDDRASQVILRERIEYGDGSDRHQSAEEREANRNLNRLGQLTSHYDEAGLQQFERYDFKGNLLGKVRQVISDTAILSVFNSVLSNNKIATYRVNWQPPADSSLDSYAAGLLDAKEYRTEMTYDALNRTKLVRYPQDVSGNRRELRPQYNRAGALEKVALDDTPYVEHIAYNAKGQRTLVAFGNRVMTRYAYNLETSRLARLRTEGYSQPNELTYRPTGAILQDYAYEYDLIGNITAIQDRTLGSGIQNNPQGGTVNDPQLARLLTAGDALIRQFTYDPTYRLLSATGRECDRPPETAPWEDFPRCTDLTRTRAYSESYQYDSVGNVLQLQHQSDGSGFTRRFIVETANNRLASMQVARRNATTTHAYTYDVNGNIVRENQARHFEWDYSDRLKAYYTQAGDATPSVHAHYLYDGAGQRVKKLVRNQGGEITATVYIDGIFEHHFQGEQENNSLHIMDDTARIALVRVGAPFPDDRTLAVKYHLNDHLGSSNVVVSATGELINREEYTPFGETSFGSFSKKRYRFTGKEKDEESGLNYHGARYYAPYLQRWISADPAGMIDGLNLYRYVRNNPLTFNDPTGTETKDGSTKEKAIEVDQLHESMPADIRKRAEAGEPYFFVPGSQKKNLGQRTENKVREMGGKWFVLRQKKGDDGGDDPVTGTLANLSDVGGGFTAGGDKLNDRAIDKAEDEVSEARRNAAEASKGKRGGETYNEARNRKNRAADQGSRTQRQKVKTLESRGAKIRGVDKFLKVAGPVLDGVAQYQTSKAKTTAGKLTSAVLAGAFDVLLGKNPYVAAADSAINLIFGVSIAQIVQGGIDAAVVAAEACALAPAQCRKDINNAVNTAINNAANIDKKVDGLYERTVEMFESLFTAEGWRKRLDWAL